MKLHRLATISLDRDMSPAPPMLTSNSVVVECHRTTLNGESNRHILAIASIDLSPGIQVDADGYVVLPAGYRSECEDAIMYCADVLGVCARSRRRVGSAFPSVAFSELSGSERTLLDSSRGFLPMTAAVASAVPTVDLANAQLMASLKDRAAGVYLLAEVHSSDSSLARYRELLRFFEHAFRLDSVSLQARLSIFLSGAGYGYTANEIADWMTLRGGVVHGDFKRAKRLVTESEVRLVLGRMEQAAYDVLFNKQLWHDNSSARRLMYKPDCALGEGGATNLRLRAGAPAQFIITALDDWSVFPKNFQAVWTQLPDSWWVGPRAAE